MGNIEFVDWMNESSYTSYFVELGWEGLVLICNWFLNFLIEYKGEYILTMCHFFVVIIITDPISVNNFSYLDITKHLFTDDKALMTNQGNNYAQL